MGGIWRERQREPIELVPVAEDEQEQGVRTGALDMALVRLPVDRDGLHLIPLYEELPVAVMGSEHVLTLLDEVTTDDLADEHQDWAGRQHHRTPSRRSRPAPGCSSYRCRWRGCTTARTSPTARSPTCRRRQVGLAWLVDNDDPRIQTFIGIVRGRSERSSAAS